VCYNTGSGSRHVIQESNQFWVSIFCSSASCQQISKLDRGRAEDMLHTVSDEVAEANYDDPKLRGLAWDAKLAEAKQQNNEAKSFNMATPQVAAMLDTLNDFESPSE